MHGRTTTPRSGVAREKTVRSTLISQLLFFFDEAEAYSMYVPRCAFVVFSYFSYFNFIIDRINKTTCQMVG